MTLGERQAHKFKCRLRFSPMNALTRDPPIWEESNPFREPAALFGVVVTKAIGEAPRFAMLLSRTAGEKEVSHPAEQVHDGGTPRFDAPGVHGDGHASQLLELCILSFPARQAEFPDYMAKSTVGAGRMQTGFFYSQSILTKEGHIPGGMLLWFPVQRQGTCPDLFP